MILGESNGGWGGLQAGKIKTSAEVPGRAPKVWPPWSAILRQLKVNMPKAAYDKWVRDAVLLSASDGIFVIGAPDGYARDWLESRLSNTTMRLLTGICNRSVEIKFVDLNDLTY